MLYIMTTPRVRDRFLREIDEAIEGGKVSKPITSDEGEKLPYLQASLRPTLTYLRNLPPSTYLPTYLPKATYATQPRTDRNY